MNILDFSLMFIYVSNILMNMCSYYYVEINNLYYTLSYTVPTIVLYVYYKIYFK